MLETTIGDEFGRRKSAWKDAPVEEEVRRRWSGYRIWFGGYLGVADTVDWVSDRPLFDTVC